MCYLPKVCRQLLLLLFVCCGVASDSLAAGINDAPSSKDFKADVEAQAVQPVGVPILVQIKFTNISQKAITYWCGGPDTYPNANWFIAKVTDDAGKVILATMKNGQYTEGSGYGRKIEPAVQVTIPALLPPLKSGSYSIQIGAGEKAAVKVEDSPDILRQRDQEILAKLRQGDPFTQFVFEQDDRIFLQNALLQDLVSDNDQAALQAASALQFLSTAPDSWIPYVSRAMQKQLNADPNNGRLMVALAEIAKRIGSDSALNVVLTLAHSQQYSEVRRQAVSCLGEFKQENVTSELRSLVKEADGSVVYEAYFRLAMRGDPLAADWFVKNADSPYKESRRTAFELLARYYPRDTRVEPLLRKSLLDPDEEMRRTALGGLELLGKKP